MEYTRPSDGAQIDDEEVAAALGDGWSVECDGPAVYAYHDDGEPTDGPGEVPSSLTLRPDGGSVLVDVHAPSSIRGGRHDLVGSVSGETAAAAIEAAAEEHAL